MADGTRMSVNSFCRNVPLDAVKDAFVTAGFAVSAIARSMRKVTIEVMVRHTIPRYGKVACFATVLCDDEDAVLRYSGMTPQEYYHLNRYCSQEMAMYQSMVRQVWESLKRDLICGEYLAA